MVCHLANAHSICKFNSQKRFKLYFNNDLLEISQPTRELRRTFNSTIKYWSNQQCLWTFTKHYIIKPNLLTQESSSSTAIFSDVKKASCTIENNKSITSQNALQTLLFQQTMHMKLQGFIISHMILKTTIYNR